MSHPLRTTSLAIVAVVLLTGCSQTSQGFWLFLTVVDKTNGKPISGAHVEVDTGPGNEKRKTVPVWPESGFQTDQAGCFNSGVLIGGYDPPKSSGEERWYLKVRKEGYKPVVIDIKPKPLPERKDNESIPVTVQVEMQPVKNAGR